MAGSVVAISYATQLRCMRRKCAALATCSTKITLVHGIPYMLMRSIAIRSSLTEGLVQPVAGSTVVGCSQGLSYPLLGARLSTCQRVDESAREYVGSISTLSYREV